MSLASKFLERDVSRQAANSNPGFAAVLRQIRMTGAPIPSLLQLITGRMGETGQRKAGLDKIMPGISGASKAASVAPKGDATSGKERFSVMDILGMRK